MKDTTRFKPNTVYVTYIAATPEQVWAGADRPGVHDAIFSGWRWRSSQEWAALSGCSFLTAGFTSAAG